MQESRNAEGVGKRNAEGAEMRKTECDRIVGRWMNGRGVTERRTDGWKEGRTDGKKDGQKEGQTDRQTDGTYCAGVKDLASAYVLCPRLTEQCLSIWRVRITERA